MKDINLYMQFGLGLIGWVYIMFKAGEWFTKTAFKQWDKRRKESRQQKAVNELYDAFELDKIDAASTVRLATKDNLVIMMYRTEGKP
ncbi:DUF4752 family protein [Enterobacteriaceae bacterium H11S18]|uniref:DUF4752 family protein n=1 Tax=Dryocola clanedunensis TaxID=2925396 RepID=UPI0022F0C3EB|nr:DUF4752 family protein [Dryocola clanedunensis]MCT4708799.1 DUF4752 family protein [Dryocola clanedunensis]